MSHRAPDLSRSSQRRGSVNCQRTNAVASLEAPQVQRALIGLLLKLFLDPVLQRFFGCCVDASHYLIADLLNDRIKGVTYLLIEAIFCIELDLDEVRFDFDLGRKLLRCLRFDGDFVRTPYPEAYNR
jgi:hypothetical protein